jgi:hypothetical protein
MYEANEDNLRGWRGGDGSLWIVEGSEFSVTWRTKVSRGKNGTDGCFGQRRDDVQLPSPWQSNMVCEGNLSGHGGGRVYGELRCGGRFGIRCSLCSHSHLKP